MKKLLILSLLIPSIAMAQDNKKPVAHEWEYKNTQEGISSGLTEYTDGTAGIGTGRENCGGGAEGTIQELEKYLVFTSVNDDSSVCIVVFSKDEKGRLYNSDENENCIRNHGMSCDFTSSQGLWKKVK